MSLVPGKNSGSHSGGPGGESSQGGLSLREFARQLGVSDTAVRKAIKAGRLKESLGKNGKILNFEIGQREFMANGRSGLGARTSGSQVTTQASAAQPPPAQVQPPPAESRVPSPEQAMLGVVVDAQTLFEAQRLATLQRERKLRLENDVTEGRLIHLDRMTKEAFEAERIIRENILNLPARMAGELHAERDPARFYLKFEAALREALNLAADTLQATANG